MDGSAELNVEGQLQELTLVVCEIFNHQQLMEALEPARYATVSNRFLHAATDALVEQGGTLAASDGEGVRVLFGAPLPVASHASVALPRGAGSGPAGAQAQPGTRGPSTRG